MRAREQRQRQRQRRVRSAGVSGSPEGRGAASRRGVQAADSHGVRQRGAVGRGTCAE